MKLFTAMCFDINKSKVQPIKCFGFYDSLDAVEDNVRDWIRSSYPSATAEIYSIESTKDVLFIVLCGDLLEVVDKSNQKDYGFRLFQNWLENNGEFERTIKGNNIDSELRQKRAKLYNEWLLAQYGNNENYYFKTLYDGIPDGESFESVFKDLTYGEYDDDIDDMIELYEKMRKRYESDGWMSLYDDDAKVVDYEEIVKQLKNVGYWKTSI